MAFELEALVGHLYIVGGRSINTTPPGTLVEVAPKKAARGRETDTFFVMVMPSGEIAPTTFYEQMASLAAERYFSNTGSVTSALRAVFNTLNHNLFEHNHEGHQHYEANIVAAVLRGTELYVGRVGAAVSVLRVNGETSSFPDELSDDDSLYQPPLGVQPIPVVQLLRYNINQGTRLVMGDANLADMRLDPISTALMAGDMEQVLDSLTDLATLQVQLLAAEFVPPEEPLSVVAATGASTAAITAEVSAARVRARAAANPRASGERSRRQGQQLQKQLQQQAGNLAQNAGNNFSAVGEFLERALPDHPQEKQRRLSRRTALIALTTIPLTFVVLVIVLWVSGIGTTEFEDCVERAEGATQLARTMNSADVNRTQAAWQAALTIIEACEGLRAEDPIINSLRLEAQTVIDALNNVERRSAQLIANVPDTVFGRLVLQGLDLYALDEGNQIVYRFQLTGATPVLGQPIANMRQGATVDGLQVGQLVDIAFDSQENAIVALDRNGVVIRCQPRLINECAAQRVLNSENWVNPIGMAFYLGRLYVLDVGVGQIWRYDPSGGQYASMPREYFTGQIRPAMTNAVDFAISEAAATRGVIFILYADGVMTSYLGGEPRDFAYSDFPPGQDLETVTVQSMMLNDSPISPGFLLVSQPSRTIYETTSAGTFQNAFRIFDEDLFALLEHATVDPGQGVIYAASGNAIFALNKDG